LLPSGKGAGTTRIAHEYGQATSVVAIVVVVVAIVVVVVTTMYCTVRGTYWAGKKRGGWEYPCHPAEMGKERRERKAGG
jgi:hypothetical protein